MILALNPCTTGWTGVLCGGGPGANPVPPEPWEAPAPGTVAPSHTPSTQPISIVLTTRKSHLFRRPTGLAVGLALKELRPRRIYRRVRPGNLGPPFRGCRAPRIRLAAL